ncbi:MAG: hypothetical protein WCE75_09415 [Terracidiphilus sp.]
MRAISAVDSVSLAVQRTRDFLFRPFNWATYLKLGLVAIVTEGVGSNFRSNIGGRHPGQPSGHGPMIYSPSDIPAAWIAAAVAAILLVVIVSLFIGYLVTRLRFAYFHCLIHNTTEIRPGWRLYRDQATRFFWLNVVVGFCFLLLVVLAALPFVAGFWRLFHEMSSGGHPDIGLILALVLPLLPVILLLALLGVLTDLVLRDGLLPHYALDDATAGEAWTEVWARIRAEKRQFVVYALLRVVLPAIAMVGVFAVLLLPGLMVAGAAAAIEYGIHSAFAHASGASTLVGIVLQVFFGVLAFGFAMLLSICVGGPVSTGIREYALTFYGGRYQALGEMLDPPAPPLPAPPGAPRFA